MFTEKSQGGVVGEVGGVFIISRPAVAGEGVADRGVLEDRHAMGEGGKGLADGSLGFRWTQAIFSRHVQ